MSSILNIRNLAAAAILTVGLACGTSTATASDCHQPRVYYKTVIVYETIRQPYVSWITMYDHCDQPYQVKVVKYKSIQVPVEKRIRVAF